MPLVSTDPVTLSIRDPRGIPRLYRLSPVEQRPGQRWAWRLYGGPEHDWVVAVVTDGELNRWLCSCKRYEYGGRCKHTSAVKSVLESLGFYTGVKRKDGVR